MSVSLPLTFPAPLSCSLSLFLRYFFMLFNDYLYVTHFRLLGMLPPRTKWYGPRLCSISMLPIGRNAPKSHTGGVLWRASAIYSPFEKVPKFPQLTQSAGTGTIRSSPAPSSSSHPIQRQPLNFPSLLRERGVVHYSLASGLARGYRPHVTISGLLHSSLALCVSRVVED